MDEAMVTGESAPVRKAPGDALIGGTVNRSGAVVMRVSRVGADTVLATIARLVMNAQMSKAPVQARGPSVRSDSIPGPLQTHASAAIPLPCVPFVHILAVALLAAGRWRSEHAPS
jgi:cation transport ATPase